MDGIEGIEMAIENILASAELGYNIIGSDVAGFSGKTIPPRLYIRWAQFSAFCGLFLNGGHGERALWKRSKQELEIIRKFSWLHTELIPYIYSHTVLCHQGGKPLQRPIDGKYHYLFGDDFLIAPIFQDSPKRAITLPEGRWYYFFDNNESIQGPKTFIKDFPLDEYPVYIKEGAIIPLNITRGYTGIGDSTSSGYITLLLYPADEENQFVLHHPVGGGNTTIHFEKYQKKIKILLEGRKISHILKILLPHEPVQVMLDNIQLTESDDWIYDIKDNYLLIKTNDYSKGNYTIFMN
jgi:alpha-glucosidase (family GH31 glycosyl hydrolase)